MNLPTSAPSLCGSLLAAPRGTSTRSSHGRDVHGRKSRDPSLCVDPRLCWRVPRASATVASRVQLCRSDGGATTCDGPESVGACGRRSARRPCAAASPSARHQMPVGHLSADALCQDEVRHLAGAATYPNARRTVPTGKWVTAYWPVYLDPRPLLNVIGATRCQEPSRNGRWRTRVLDARGRETRTGGGHGVWTGCGVRCAAGGALQRCDLAAISSPGGSQLAIGPSDPWSMTLVGVDTAPCLASVEGRC